MPSLSPKDRITLCLFSYEDARRCRTPRTGTHPHFCYYHAQKEAQAQAAEKLSKDLANFFSGDYLSACDLSTALARLIPAVVRGDIKPRLARTVAYMFQTQLQSIHLSQHEYINAFGTDGWRKAIRTSVNVNYDYRFPPNHEPSTDSAAKLPAQTPAESTLPLPTQTPTAVSSPQPPSRPQTPIPSCPTPAQSAQSQSPATVAPPPKPNHDPYAVHFDHNYRLRESPKLL